MITSRPSPSPMLHRIICPAHIYLSTSALALHISTSKFAIICIFVLTTIQNACMTLKTHSSSSNLPITKFRRSMYMHAHLYISTCICALQHMTLQRKDFDTDLVIQVHPIFDVSTTALDSADIVPHSEDNINHHYPSTSTHRLNSLLLIQSVCLRNANHFNIVSGLQQHSHPLQLPTTHQPM